MTEGLAIEIAERKMKELGVGDNFLIRLRHFQIPPASKIELDAENELLILVKPDEYVKMYSKAGIFNLRDNRINEMQYIHRGKTWIINQETKRYLQVKIIQVIPNIKLK